MMMNPASRELVTPQRLRAFFAPESIALVGASENSGWARFIVASCAATGFAGPLTAVHPRARTAFGLPVVPSLRDLPEPADLAFILAPAQAVEGVLDDMGAAGIPNAVVLASGYREVGEDGRARQEALVARAIANGVTVLGPNCLGFVNAHTRAAPYALSLLPPLIAGPVGVALQSGALASVVLGFARAHAIGLSVLTSMGNECLMRTVDVLDYLVEDEATRVICLFLEEIGDPAEFAQVAEKADRAGKPIVTLKVGASPAGQQTALAHTGSVAGDDAVAGAALRQLNGVLVTPMRSGGAELLAGVTVDPTFGPVLAVGLGGIWVEVLKDTSLRLLPVDAAEVKRMLGELRGLPLLAGARGTPPADLDAVAEAIAGLGHTALSLNGALRVLEVNPLWVNGDQVEALDVLVVTGPSGTEHGT